MPEQSPTPSDWAGAFAALPAETPPAGGWTRLAERLAEQPVAAAAAAPASVAATARRSRQRWALAAMLAAALPLGLWLGLRAQRPAQGPVSEPLVRQAPPAAAPQRDAATAPARTDDGNQRIAASGQADGGNRSVAGSADRGRDSASEARPTPTPATADTTQPTRTATAERRLATATNVVPQPRAAATASSDAAASAAPDHVVRASDDARLAAQLRELQAESAQLEALVAAARDERVASAAAAVMSADLDQRLRLIDTALIDGALPAVSRVALWRERVDSLRALAGVESTQRWFAARGGERYDGALVRVD
ncbi:hypothetical protein [Lysobacter enzymogenes]|uniref:hypothetical protein n=1 Tax=Lysobacter enzymogenes TaxID=69 RepID=UPI00099C1DE9|nr:hypothetical protein [Lysobacter enzymogenes]UZW59685.1 hypothetical protein BV903_020710 [Lysobacter enzymogenes]